MTERAVLAGGCFWGMQDLIRKLPGVLETRVGYTGGDVQHATYRNHGTHAEGIEITFDPDQISYRQLLEVFFQVHDPTTKDRQGNDVGPQYRSIILTHSDDQDKVARDVIQQFDEEATWDDPIVTKVERLDRFWPAEQVHQGYYDRNPAQPYCQAIISPKVAKLRTQWAHLLRDAA